MTTARGTSDDASAFSGYYLLHGPKGHSHCDGPCERMAIAYLETVLCVDEGRTLRSHDRLVFLQDGLVSILDGNDT